MFQTVQSVNNLDMAVFSNKAELVLPHGKPLPLKTPMIFDEGLPNVIQSDTKTLSVNDFSISFFAADYSSLLFTVRSAVARSGVADIYSTASLIRLTAEDAKALAEELECRVDIAQAENEFYEKNAAAIKAHFCKVYGRLAPAGLISQA